MFKLIPLNAGIFPDKQIRKTFYRSETAVSENWIYIFNFFVDSFGEWQYGSGEKVKMPDHKNILRKQ